jgi:hypothetical protein
MRRPVAAVLAATIACSAAVIVSPTPSSADTTRAHAVVRPHAAPTITPAKGIAITMGFANKLTDTKAAFIANELFSFVAEKLHANAVSLNFPFWESGSLSNDPMRAPMTSSPQRMMAITAIAHHYHLSVQWRPFLFESDLLYQTHDSIRPTDPNIWMRNYWNFLEPYLEAANLSGAASFSIALELRTMLPYLSQWTTIVRRAKSLFSGTLFYSQQHLPQVSLPLTARGYDAYQPIDLKSAKDLSVARLTRGFIYNLHVPEMQQTPADLTLEEISIPGVPYAYLRPSHFHLAKNVKLDRPVQTEWFEAACNAFYQLHLQGIYYYGIAFDRYVPNENQSANPFGWLGTPSATAIANCFARHTVAAPAAASRPATRAPSGATASTAHLVAGATTVTWAAPQAVEPTGGHPSSVSCPTTTFCAAADLGGDVITETSGKWSVPLQVDSAPLVSVSCASATLCIAVDGSGNAFRFDGSSWSEEAAVDSVAFTSVSCVVKSTTCVAVDVAGDALTYSAGAWSAPVWTKGYPDNAISCPSTSFCVAADVAGFVHVFDGTWENQLSLGDSVLTSVACASTTYCVVGNDEGRLFSDVSGRWASQGDVIAGGVASVACASEQRCEAVGANASAGASITKKWVGSGHVFVGDGAVAVSCAPQSACTAVSYDGNVTIRTTKWGAPFSIDARPGNLTSVGCSSETFCMAVDDAGSAMTWSGATWSAPTATGLSSLSGVSCAATICMAVSNIGDAVEYSDGAWGKPVSIDASDLTAVSCTSATFCAATDASNHVLTFDGTTWTAPSTEGVPQHYVRGYTALSCVAPANCVAVDTDGGELFFSPGAGFLYQADTRFVPLTGVACATKSLCVAVDEQGNAITYSGTSNTWTLLHIDPYRLTAVSCTPAGYCLATDDHGGTVAFNNGTWSPPTRTVPLGAISAVSCTGTSTCVATDPSNAAVSTASF